MEYVIIVLFSFLIGSFPTAYLVLKNMRNLDIRNEGSCNMGALNTAEVSNSKLLGLLVLAIDFTKGFLAVYLTWVTYGDNFIFMAIAINTAVLGHNFSPWIKFRGGRGLATAAGGSVWFAPVILVVWCVFWVATVIFRKNILLGNLMASALVLTLSISSAEALNKFSLPPAENPSYLSIAFGTLMVLILIKHIEPSIEWIKKFKENNEANNASA